MTEIGQPSVFIIVEVSKKWYDGLPADLQQILDRAGAQESAAINPWAVELNGKVRQGWLDKGGQAISLPPDDQAAMMSTLASVAEDVSKAKPELGAAYGIVTDAAKRTR